MGKKRKPKTVPTPTPAPSAPSEKPASDKLRLGLLAATIGTFVARPLVISESAVLGDGLLLVMILLLIATFWALDQARRRDARLRFNSIDAAVLLLVGFYCVSGLIAIPSGNSRAILNMIWLWIGLTAGYFLLRQLIDHALETRAIVAVMIATAIAVASHGLYQYCWEFPQMRAAYAADPDAMLQGEGMWYPPDSSARQQFDNRINSREPLAMFALTNSLAGFLAPWLIVTAGIFLQPTTASPKKQNADRIKLAVLLSILAACFLLTKSRTAWAAVAFGVLGLGLWWKLRGRTISMKWVVASAAILAVLVGITIAAGGLDSQVIGEAGKSLKYRFEYWQSTAKMIAADPWFGTGPGRYQEIYTQYKLPQASEEPSDPHNFLFEIAATAGIFTLAAMIAVLLLFLARLLRSKQNSLAVEPSSTLFETASSSPTRKFIYLGALIGYLASFPIGIMGTVPPDVFIYWGALPIGILALLALDCWVRRGTLSPTLLALAWAVLSINLLAAGGISFPGVAASFWMLLALALASESPSLTLEFNSESPSSSSKPKWRLSDKCCHAEELKKPDAPTVRKHWSQKPLFGVALHPQTLCATTALISFTLLITCYFTAYGPVLTSFSESNAAYMYPRHSEKHLTLAAEADPWAIEPWIQLSNIAFMQWQADPTPERFERFLNFDREVLDRIPQKSLAWFTSAKRSHEAYLRMRRPTDLQRALDAYRQAVKLYPNHSLYRAEWALALQIAGKKTDSVRQAQKSLDLDQKNPHNDKRLPATLRQLLERITPKKLKSR